MNAALPRPVRNRLLATGLVIDAPEEGTTFPSAGGNSSDPRVQAVYWRCVVTLFATARLADPAQRLALFCNAEPPVVDGTDLGRVLARYGVELRRVPLTIRIDPTRNPAWGNVLYFADIMSSLADEADELAVALVDSDVLVTAPLGPLFARIGEADFTGYAVDTAPEEQINGMTLQSMTQAARSLSRSPLERVTHFGGELFGTTVGAWKRHEALFRTILDQAAAGIGPAAAVRTEEHVFSIAFAQPGVTATKTNDLIKRIWTSPNHNTARPGDERLPLWHLPAEKRYGLADLYDWLHRQGWPMAMDPEALRAAAMRLCGVPRKSAGKLIRDGVRQVAAKLGLRL
jgi:hypothetical protein